MKRYYQAYLLLLALTAWLLPIPRVYAQDISISEKVGITIVSQGSDWVLEGDKVVAEQLYQEWLKEQAKPRPKPKQISAEKTAKTKFAAGYCTDYVAQKVNVTWSGNANRWITNAKAQGYLVDMNPVPGAILVTNESRLYGHVTYIESVQGSEVTISEWNYAGRYKLTYRTFDISDWRIKGIIHP